MEEGYCSSRVWRDILFAGFERRHGDLSAVLMRRLRVYGHLDMTVAAALGLQIYADRAACINLQSQGCRHSHI